MSADEVLATVRASGLLQRGQPVVAMLSGGRDSVCLLDLAVRFCGPEHVGALHLNYGLREEADGDERHCVQLCKRLGVELEVVRASRAPAPAGGARRSGPEPSGNLQAWAREVRYAEAERLAQKRDALIAAGHTASDQVETILYRLAASPGRRALLGMPASEGRLIRPLLHVTREQTGAYCQEPSRRGARASPRRASGRGARGGSAGAGAPAGARAAREPRGRARLDSRRWPVSRAPT